MNERTFRKLKLLLKHAICKENKEVYNIYILEDIK